MKKPFSRVRRAFSFLETQVFGAVKHLSQDVNYGIIILVEEEMGSNSAMLKSIRCFVYLCLFSKIHIQKRRNKE